MVKSYKEEIDNSLLKLEEIKKNFGKNSEEFNSASANVEKLIFKFTCKKNT